MTEKHDEKVLKKKKNTIQLQMGDKYSLLHTDKEIHLLSTLA